MEITFLGTGTSQGTPVIACNCKVCKSSNKKDKRLRTSILISIKDKNFIIDTGPDFRQQILRENITDITAVLFTHGHKDHVAGLDDIRAFNSLKKTKMQIFANKEVQKVLKREFFYAFETKKHSGVPNIKLNKIEKNKSFKIENINFIPINVKHHKLDVLGFKINNFSYITDANFILEKELDKLKNTDILVINALRKTKHISHFTLQEAIEISEKINPKKTYIIHISHQMGLQIEEEKKLPKNIFFAYDGLKIIL